MKLKKLEKALSVLLAVSMCAGMLSAPAFAAEGSVTSPVDGETYTCTPEQHNSHTGSGWSCVPVYTDITENEDGSTACLLDEHQHSDECQPLICTTEEHTHTDDCYTETEVEVEKEVVDADGNTVEDDDGNTVTETVTETKRELTCGKEEHTHSVDLGCYVQCTSVEHTHGDGKCKYGQQAITAYQCTYHKTPDPVTTNDPYGVDHNPNLTYNGDYIYVFVEGDSVADAGLSSAAPLETDGGGTLDDFRSTTDVTYGSYGRFAVTETDLSAYGVDSVRDLTAAEFNQLMQQKIKSGTIQVAVGAWDSQDQKTKTITLSEEQKAALLKIDWVHVAASSKGGADGWSSSIVSNDTTTTHADGHIHSTEEDEQAYVAPTCTAPGYKVYKCVRTRGGQPCSYTKTEYIAPLGHAFSTNAAGNVTWDGSTTHHTLVCVRHDATVEVPHTLTVGAWGPGDAANDGWQLNSTTHMESRTRTVSCFCGYSYTETQTRREGQVTLTVNYRDEAGNELLPSTSENLYPGEDYNKPAPTIPGYEPINSNVSGTMPNEDKTETITYRAIDYTLTVVHVYRYHPLTGDVTSETVEMEPVTYHINAQYSTSAATRSGYTPAAAPENASGVFGAESIVVTYYYDAWEQEAPPAEPTGTPTPEPEPSGSPEPTGTPTPSEEVVVPPVNIPMDETPTEVEVPDVDIPMDEVEVPDVDIPMNDVPEEIEIEDDGIPMADVPQTGDISAVWYAVALSSALGLLAVAALERKQRKDSLRSSLRRAQWP